MAWFKVDDSLHSHPKAIAAGNAALGLWARCGSYVSHYGTDGFIPDAIAKSFGTRAEISRLVAIGLWHMCKDGYTMHDFLDYNPTAEQVAAERLAAKQRKARWRESQRDPPSANGDLSRRDTPVPSPVPSRRSPRRSPSGDETRDEHCPDPDPTPLYFQSLTTSTVVRGDDAAEDDQRSPIAGWAERRRMP